MALPGTPVGDLIHRRALSSANRPGDPYHHPLGAMNPQFADCIIGQIILKTIMYRNPISALYACNKARNRTTRTIVQKQLN